MTTIKDVAKAAGVSITTVSRALNDYHDVSVQTKQKIRQIAEELGYIPNLVARSLVSKKTKTIGLLLSNLTRTSTKDNIAYEVLCGMNDRTGELDYDLILFSTTSQKQRMKSYRSLCQERGVDGVIIMGMRLDDPYLEEITSSSIPCVLIDIEMKADHLAYITSDHKSGAYQAVVHLLQLGHRNIAMINGHEQADVSRTRLEGYKQALHDNGIAFDPKRVEDGNFTEAGGMQSAMRLLALDPGITAIFCSSDLMALGAIQGVRGLGKDVPGDISIVGFDNIVLSNYAHPPLTTIHQQKYEIGYQAAQMLIDMLQGRKIHKQVTLPIELIVRSSTKQISQ